MDKMHVQFNQHLVIRMYSEQSKDDQNIGPFKYLLNVIQCMPVIC